MYVTTTADILQALAEPGMGPNRKLRPAEAAGRTSTEPLTFAELAERTQVELSEVTVEAIATAAARRHGLGIAETSDLPEALATTLLRQVAITTRRMILQHLAANRTHPGDVIR